MDTMTVKFGIRVRCYKATADQADSLLQITQNEINKPEFPKQIFVLTSISEGILSVIALEPDFIPWNWGREFKPFEQNVDFTQIHPK